MAAATAAAVASTLALATYIDGKFHIRQDLASIRKVKAATKAYTKLLKANRLSPWFLFADAVAKYPSHRAIWFRGQVLTYTELHDQAVQLAQWMLSKGVRPGALVAMYMTNRPEFMVTWLALLCIGCAPAFINHHLEGRSLLHCLDVCDSKLLFVDEDPECQSRIEDSRGAIEQSGAKIIVFDDRFREVLAGADKSVPGDRYRSSVRPEFPICLCYTSGTTGLPKGCSFTTSRTLLSGRWYEPILGAKAGPGGDCWYNCMPMYHGTGGLCAIGFMLAGLSMAIGPKFSTSNFWKDVCESESTYFVYVGEIIRYMLNAPYNPYERAHRIRCCYGNGLRPDVWERFRMRFNVPEIAEFFSSSEGMFNLVNWNKGDFTAAHVGHHGLILRRKHNDIFVPVKIDHNAGSEIWRDPLTGFAQRMHYNLGGEIIVRISSEKEFQGYWRAEEATKKKFVRNVFQNGDLYYRTGDALRRDSDGRWSFMDRLGDTFRWKSENVSTEEVAIVLASYPGVVEANVYGVLVPGHDGRAGCAALHLEAGSFDFNALLEFARAQLPKYAVPAFLRIQSGGSTHTHNFKQNKLPLRIEGIDPTKIGTENGTQKDQLLWVPPRQDTYANFGEKEWEALQSGAARL